ncbi:hypothetical protein ACFFLM_00765 [Deinococcus oregonensis]|uniref:Uncharacterized protein n=1 Tax=Deinococcus oregonensis TaxID=1805970 RepID=A0ABV6ASQ0_9DEIO
MSAIHSWAATVPSQARSFSSVICTHALAGQVLPLLDWDAPSS